ncbi:cysteine protease StiP family protein [Bacillus massiliigorillae]|uniref:cysteine protease StiP family protein n=1 Tax=Bacillus massiliigorillae TaxID=1243664 RepID=UPI0003AAB4D4|nr:cysteine protease StiP family protein [Bacillus massiliigorillae]
MLYTTREPDIMGSYSQDDIQFLLRDISTIMSETKTEDREKLIQSGRHYSEMLPIEYQPNEEYVALFSNSLQLYAKRIAIAVGVVAEQIVKKNGLQDLVIASLARAGTPIGILIKRYIKHKYKVNIPHYSISIIRGRGIDKTAIQYIFSHHPNAHIQFVDGWTGKGAITTELQQACASYNSTHEKRLDSSLAVLADPGHCTELFGTREDFLIPSACLNSTVSGLVSRTVLNYEFMEEDDFHGAKFYKDLSSVDVSNLYINTITNEFAHVDNDTRKTLLEQQQQNLTPTWKGMQSVFAIGEKYNISNIHFIKPGVGETSRVLLRRVPWKILINPLFSNDLTHILLLAKERKVPIEEYTEMSYSCCGIIKEL